MKQYHTFDTISTYLEKIYWKDSCTNVTGVRNDLLIGLKAKIESILGTVKVAKNLRLTRS